MVVLDVIAIVVFGVFMSILVVLLLEDGHPDPPDKDEWRMM